MKKQIKNETVDLETGEITSDKPKLNEVIIVRTRRADGSLREQQDFSYCPTLAEQHTAHLTNLNYLIDKYKPDELAAYMAARNQYRQEILGHDFSNEPSYQEAKNHVYNLQQRFEELPDDLKRNFRSAVEFYKFIDNPQNQDKMVSLGLLTKKEAASLATDSRTTTQEKDVVKEQ